VSKLATTAARAAAKIRLIALSELSASSKLRYLLDISVRRLWPRQRRGTRGYRLQGARSIELRENSTDWNVFEEIFIERVYARHAAAVPPAAGPLVLIDLGANIGLSAIALAHGLHPVRVVAVEPDAANFSMLVENLRRAGLSTRSVALQAFAGAEPGFAELQDAGYGAWGMRMGPASGWGIPIFPVAGIVARAGVNGRVVLKCDIEGSEGQLFEHMRAWEHLVDFIILELHTEFFSAGALHACLEGSRFEWRIHGEIPPGACLAVFGIERLREKPVAIGQAAGLTEFCS
jgi:FkbM family methyltransferase